MNHKKIQFQSIQAIQLLANGNRQCCNALVNAGGARTLQDSVIIYLYLLVFVKSY